MTQPYIPGLDGPPQLTPEEMVKVVQQAADKIKLLEAKNTSKYYEQFIAGVTEDTKRAQTKKEDRMANVCRLATAALSHITAEIDESDTDIDGHLQSAFNLLKPLAGGAHDTHPWEANLIAGVNVLDNDAYDDDPWNEWGTHKPLPDTTPSMFSMLHPSPYTKLPDLILNPPEGMLQVISAGNLPPDMVEQQQRVDSWEQYCKKKGINPNRAYVFNESMFNGDKDETQYQQLLNMIGFLADRVQILEEKEKEDDNER